MRVTDKQRKALTAVCDVLIPSLEGDVYWQRNWSVKRVAEELTVKTVDGEMWLFNPVSELWYSLRYEKDRFSTLNQGTGVYCFDRWIWYILSKREQVCSSVLQSRGLVPCLSNAQQVRCASRAIRRLF